MQHCTLAICIEFTNPEVDPVYDLHLLEEGRLAGLSGAQQQYLDQPIEAAPLHLQIPVDAATLDPPLHLLGTFLRKNCRKTCIKSVLQVLQCSLDIAAVALSGSGKGISVKITDR